MPLDYTIFSDKRYVHVTAIDRQRMDDMIAVIDRLTEDPDFRGEYSVIFDLRRAGYTAELNDGDDFVKALKEHKDLFHNLFILLVPEELHVLARLFAALAAAGGFDRMRVTTELSEALRWTEGEWRASA